MLTTVGITTRNRRDELATTLTSVDRLEPRPPTIVIDDGSEDDTSDFVRAHFPWVELYRFDQSVGLIERRNQLAKLCRTQYLASIDDDASFTDPYTLTLAEEQFRRSPNTAVVALPYINVLIDASRVLQGQLQGFENTRSLGLYTGTAHVLQVSHFLRCGGYPGYLIRQGEETYYSLRVLENSQSILTVPAGPLHHRHSKKRDSDTIMYYARRNEVLVTLLTWPRGMIFKRCLHLLFRCGRVAWSTKRFTPNIRGYLDGYSSFAQHRSERKPVSSKSVLLHLRLVKQEYRSRFE